MAEAVQERLVQAVLGRVEALRAADLLPGVAAVRRLHVPPTEDAFTAMTQPAILVTDYGEQETDLGAWSVTDGWGRSVVVVFYWRETPTGAMAAALRLVRENVFRGLSGWRPGVDVPEAGPGSLEPRQIEVHTQGTQQHYGGLAVRFPCREPRGVTL